MLKIFTLAMLRWNPANSLSGQNSNRATRHKQAKFNGDHTSVPPKNLYVCTYIWGK